jgi:hypothetical protein
MASSAPLFRQDIDAKGPLSALYKGSSEPSLVFPSDLADLEHFAIFAIRERAFTTDNLRTSSKPNTKKFHNIFLPMPPQLQTSYGVTYQNAELGGAGAATLSAGGALFGKIGEAINAGTVSGGVDKLVEAGSSLVNNITEGVFSGVGD